MNNRKILKSRKDDQIIDCSDHPVVGLWMQKLMGRDLETYYLLVRNNSELFKRFLGKPWWEGECDDGWSFGWQISSSGFNWIILTGEQGTIYRIKVPLDGYEYLTDPRVGASMVNFLQKFSFDLQTIVRGD